MDLLSKNKLAELSKLSQKKYRRLEKKIVVEGLNCILQLWENSISPLELYILAGYSDPMPEATIPKYTVTQQDMTRICESSTPSGIAALFCIPTFIEPQFKKALYLDGISDPGNMGTIFRTATAFGIDAIYLSRSCCETFSPKVVRSSLGSVFWLPHVELDDEDLLKNRSCLVALHQNGKILLQNYQPGNNSNSIYVIGAEATGIREQILNGCSQSIRLCMSRDMESLNAAVSAGVLCWWLFSQSKDCI